MYIHIYIYIYTYIYIYIYIVNVSREIGRTRDPRTGDLRPPWVATIINSYYY